MIEPSRGDILRAGAEALVNTVNCVGVMGRGIALQFRKSFPANFQEYKSACARGEVQPGRMFIHDRGAGASPRYIVNFPTKRHWKGKSHLEDIETGLTDLVGEVRRLGIRSIAVPPLGCGLGGLEWSAVRPRIERAFARTPETRVLLFEPAGAPAAEAMVRETQPPAMTLGRAALVGLIRRYLAGGMDDGVTLLEVHKLAYFMQEAGERLRLRFQKAPYGPYAENLRHVLNVLEGHLIRGYGDAEDRPGKRIDLVPGAWETAEGFLSAHPATRGRFQRVAQIIDGFESPFGLELLSTVHWVAVHEDARDADGAMARAYAWSERKRMFTAGHLRAAWQALQAAGWVGRERTLVE